MSKSKQFIYKLSIFVLCLIISFFAVSCADNYKTDNWQSYFSITQVNLSNVGAKVIGSGSTRQYYWGYFNISNQSEYNFSSVKVEYSIDWGKNIGKYTSTLSNLSKQKEVSVEVYMDATQQEAIERNGQSISVWLNKVSYIKSDSAYDTNENDFSNENNAIKNAIERVTAEYNAYKAGQQNTFGKTVETLYTENKSNADLRAIWLFSNALSYSKSNFRNDFGCTNKEIAKVFLSLISPDYSGELCDEINVFSNDLFGNEQNRTIAYTNSQEIFAKLNSTERGQINAYLDSRSDYYFQTTGKRDWVAACNDTSIKYKLSAAEIYVVDGDILWGNLLWI